MFEDEEIYSEYFTRGGGGLCFETPIRKRALEDFMNTCSSKSKDAIRTASSRRSSSVACQLRSASSRKTVRDAGSSIVKDVDAMARVWSCKICGLKINGPSYKAIKGCINRHLMVEHHALFRQILDERREEGMHTSGLGVKELSGPRHFVKKTAALVCFICPWCDQKLPGPLSQHIARKSKLRHMQICEKKPKKLPSLLQFYWMSRRKSRDFWKNKLKVSNAASQAKLSAMVQKAEKRGHVAFKTDIKMYGAEKRTRVGSTWICKRCLASNLGWSAKVFYGQCPGQVTVRNPSIWSQAKKQGLLEATMDGAQLDALQRAEIAEWIKHYENGSMKTLPMKAKCE